MIINDSGVIFAKVIPKDAKHHYDHKGFVMWFGDLRETLKTIRKTVFCDNAKVRWGIIINTVENDSC